MQEPLDGCCVSLGVELGKPTHFTVNTKAAGKGKLDVQFSGLAKGDAVRDVDIIDHHDNTYTVKYTPVQQVASSLDPLWPYLSVHVLSVRAPSHGGLGGWLQETLCPLWFLTWAPAFGSSLDISRKKKGRDEAGRDKCTHLVVQSCPTLLTP